MDPQLSPISTSWWVSPLPTQTINGVGRTSAGLGFLGFAMAIYWIYQTRVPLTKVKESVTEVREKVEEKIEQLKVPGDNDV
jgi:hypothetical protein